MVKNKQITFIVIAAVVLVALIAIFSFVSLDKTMDENEQTGPIVTPKITQSQAEQAALDANYDWVLELNSLGRAEVYSAAIEGNLWKVKVRNYQRPEDQKGFLIVYDVDLYSAEVDNNTKREEVN